MPVIISLLNHEIYFGISVKYILILVWLIGFVVSIIVYYREHRRFISALKVTLKVQDKKILNVIESIKDDINFKRATNIYYVSPELTPFPTAIGVFKHRIILPLTFQFTDEELYCILKHELLHFKYHNQLLKILTMVIACILWFNPIIYLFKNSAEEFFEYHIDYIFTKKSRDEHILYVQCLFDLYKKHTIERETLMVGKVVPFFASSIVKPDRNDKFTKRVKVLTKHAENDNYTRKRRFVHYFLQFAIILSFFMILQASYHAPDYEAGYTISDTRPPIVKEEDDIFLTGDSAYITRSANGNYYVNFGGTVFEIGSSIPDEFEHLHVIIEEN
jgi:beta-lactamase regulating signal transducer with metallopeptidase domain